MARQHRTGVRRYLAVASRESALRHWNPPAVGGTSLSPSEGRGLRNKPPRPSPGALVVPPPSFLHHRMLAAHRSAFRYSPVATTLRPILCPPRDVGFARDIFALANSKQAAARSRPTSSIGSDALRQRLLRPVRVSRSGQKLECALGRATTGLSTARLPGRDSRNPESGGRSTKIRRDRGWRTGGHLWAKVPEPVRFVLSNARAIPGPTRFQPAAHRSRYWRR